jgi:uncharacterized protein involved in exopolysaccharide biosynthesis
MCIALAALFFIFWPRTYQSEAQLFLRVGRESVGLDPAATTGQTMQLYTSDRADEVISAQAIFKSRGVAAQVVDKLGPEVVLGRAGPGASGRNILVGILRLPLDLAIGAVRSLDPISDREAAIITLEKHLSVTSERQATVIVVRYKADTPQLAQTVCQAVVDVAQQEHMRVHRNEASAPFFTEQQDLLREQLDQSLAALRTAKNEMGMANIEQRRETLEAQYAAIELDRLKTSQELATAQARIKDLEEQLNEIPANLVSSTKSVPNDGADILRGRLYELEVKSMDLKSRYADAHPLVIAVNEQLDEAKAIVDEQAAQRTETTDAINPIHQKLSLAMKQDRSVVAGLQSRLVELEQQKGGVLADIRALNDQDFKVDQLSREAELARTKYTQYARTMEEARIDKELQNERISNISVAQPATLAEKPVSPSRALTAAATLVLAVSGTVALVLHSERQQNPPVHVASERPTRRRGVRRRVRRDFASKTNGHSEGEGVTNKPK